MVDELIFDTQSRKVLYIIVDLDDNEKGMITAATESQIRNTFTGLAAAVASGAVTYESHPDGFYNHERLMTRGFMVPGLHPVINVSLALKMTLKEPKRKLGLAGVKMKLTPVINYIQKTNAPVCKQTGAFYTICTSGLTNF
ncbi:hypothetical protein [Dyadobacter fanqingshengii]|uniref:Uncharacterized protein n=1 Tax=Dyadobacter fanqingshengii TaxID=2906443 RepID=A0A9X1THC1_9BACT|nr:hypothetical protein [Dyadobacter fanqingshengii]MCF0041497.1 hypothetical protein [Dyadobacter fanqingshengii]USJ36784.1 hypothetical protein NFI81_03215 [Dyadobacter fanqingshengii]